MIVYSKNVGFNISSKIKDDRHYNFHALFGDFQKCVLSLPPVSIPIFITEIALLLTNFALFFCGLHQIFQNEKFYYWL